MRSEELTVFVDSGARTLMVRLGRRIVAELIYQVQTETEAFSATQISIHAGPAGWALATTVYGPGGEPLATIDERIAVGGDSLEFDRSWQVHSRTLAAVSFDLRLRSDRDRVVVLPGTRYHFGSERTPVPRSVTSIRELPTKGLVVGSESEATAFLPWDFPDIATVEISQSDSMPTIALNQPVRSESIRARVRLLPCAPLARSVLWLSQEAWQSVSAREPPDINLFLTSKQRHLRERLRDGGSLGALGAIPARLKPTFRSAARPYCGAAVAHALALGGDLEAARESAIFFLGGKRPDGALCDIYDVERRVWGSHAPHFVSGAVSVLSMCDAGTHLNGVDRLLRLGRVQEPRIGRLVSDLLSFLVEEQKKRTGEPVEDPDLLVELCSLVSFIASVQRTRGANSLRAAAAKRIGSRIVEACGAVQIVFLLAARRDRLLILLRALLDLCELRVPAPGSLISLVAGLLATRIYERDLSFPPRSKAAKLGIRTSGMSVVSESRRHLDLEGLPLALELLRAGREIGWDGAAILAGVLIAGSLQSTGGIDGPRWLELGSQPAEIDHTDWSSQGRRGGVGFVAGSRIAQSAEAVIALHAITNQAS